MSKSRVAKPQHKDKYATSAALAQRKREQEQARWKLEAERKAAETEKNRGIDPNSAFAAWEQRLLFPENFETSETDPDVELLKEIFSIRDNA